MKFQSFSLYTFILIIVFIISSCKKENENPEFDPNKTSNIAIKFDNVAGTEDLKLDSKNYTINSGEQFNVSLFQYYISNIKLKTEDGREYIVPQNQSYFLMKESDISSQKITLSNVPEGNYTQVSFTIGVDSLRNTLDVSQRTGALDIGNEQTGKSMYWSWNSGYIFVKMEGIFPQVAVGNDGLRKFRYHIGGFGGYSSKTINNIKTKTLTFGKDKALVRQGRTPEVHLTIDVLKMFNGTTNIFLANNPTVMFSPFSVNVANNYVNMFEYHHVHND